jgi:hypothetical protein
MRYVPMLFALACGGQELEIRVSDLEVTVSMLSEGGADRPRSGDVFAEIDCGDEVGFPSDRTLATPSVNDALRLRAMASRPDDAEGRYTWFEKEMDIYEDGEILVSCSSRARESIRIIYL